MEDVVDLTQDMIDQAANYALDLSGRNTALTENLSSQRDYLGCLGELAFKAFLEDHAIYSWVDYEYFDSYQRGGSDDYDFKVLRTGETIDVKTTSCGYDLLVKESAFKRKQMDFYVLVCVFKSPKAKILGYATKEMVKRRKPKMVKAMDYVVTERFLLPIKELLDHIRRC